MRHEISMLVSALKVFLKSMPASVRFNICSFGTKHTFLWPQSKSYTNSTLQEAIQHLSTFDADYGGTEIFNAIQVTIERRLVDLHWISSSLLMETSQTKNLSSHLSLSKLRKRRKEVFGFSWNRQ